MFEVIGARIADALKVVGLDDLWKPSVPWQAGRYSGHKPHRGMNYRKPMTIDLGRTPATEMRAKTIARLYARAHRKMASNDAHDQKMAQKLLRRCAA